MQHGLRVVNMRPQALPIAKVFAVNFFEREWGLSINLRQHAVLLLQDRGQLGPKGIHIQEIGHTNADARVFIHVSRADSALRAANLVRAPRLFFHTIK